MQRAEIKTFRSTIVRRNSTINFYLADDKKYVVKAYHAHYTIEEEIAAYRDLASLVNVEGRIAVPQIYGSDFESNSIDVEFIDGIPLLDYIIGTTEDDGSAIRSSLVRLFLDAKESSHKFDADPTNFLVEPESGKVYFIDPLLSGVEIEDCCIVVFLWGLIKCQVRSRSVFNLLAWWKMWKAWKRIYFLYGTLAEIEFRCINEQMDQFVSLVVGWNNEPRAHENLLMKMFRSFVVIPIWSIARQPFRYNFIRY